LEIAYANDTVVTKRDEHGIALSSVSAPCLQAMMLEQAQLTPGMRVLEIGSGGYNAPKIKPTRRHASPTRLPRSNPAQRPSSTGPVNGHFSGQISSMQIKPLTAEARETRSPWQ